MKKMVDVIFVVNNLIYIFVVMCYDKIKDYVLKLFVKGEDELVLFIC